MKPKARTLAARALMDVRRSNRDSPPDAVREFMAARTLAATMCARYLTGTGVPQNRAQANMWAEVFSFTDEQANRALMNRPPLQPKPRRVGPYRPADW